MSQPPCPRRRPAGRRVATALMSVLLVAAVARPAGAYVRYLTESGQPFHWAETCVPVTGYPNDLPEMTPAEIATAAENAANVWSSTDLACTYMRINVEMSSKATRTAKFDSFNALIFRHDSWCRTGGSGVACGYDPSALAITSVFVNTRDGRIRDGDIEVNAKYFVWANLDATTPAGDRLQDLQNALTHEMGHLIGLDHTCYTANSDRPRPVDHQGQPVPDCDKAPESIRETTMFASADKGDVSKRTLTPDDQAAACDIYPVAQDPQVCPMSQLEGLSGGGCGPCAVGGAVGDPGVVLGYGLISLAVALALVLRRAPRRKPPA